MHLGSGSDQMAIPIVSGKDFLIISLLGFDKRVSKKRARCSKRTQDGSKRNIQRT